MMSRFDRLSGLMFGRPSGLMFGRLSGLMFGRLSGLMFGLMSGLMFGQMPGRALGRMLTVRGRHATLLAIARGSLVLAMIVPAGSCSDEPAGGSPPDDGPCLSTRDYFAQRVWAPVLSQVCVNCHAPGGLAESQSSRFILQPSAYPGFLDDNLELVRSLAAEDFDGQSLILAKPSAAAPHGGGLQLLPDSAEYAALAGLVERFGEPEKCPDASLEASYDDVVLLTPVETLRKASLQLAGRLPEPEEVQALLAGGEDALPAALASLFAEDAFRAWLTEAFNDHLHMKRYLRFPGGTVNRLSVHDYPELLEFYEDDCYQDPGEWNACYGYSCADCRWMINEALASESLELIAHVVDNDRPFSEILTAPYTVVNAYSDLIYRTGTAFDDPGDPDEWRETTIDIRLYTGQIVPLPHAGVLTVPMFLDRFPSSPNNRSRHRARHILRIFLATDVFRTSLGSVNPIDAAGVEAPTMNAPSCAGCHRILDPIAGAFMKWSYVDYLTHYYPWQEWYDDMFPPGYGTELMPEEEQVRGQVWLAQRIVDDPRFVVAAVHLAFRAITGQDPIDYPDDPGDPNLASRFAAWSAQDRLFRAWGEQFVGSGMNFKKLLAAVLTSPYYRANNVASPPGSERAVELADVGASRLGTPESISRKIAAVVGMPWVRADGEHTLATNFNILFGGIDSETIVERIGVVNGIMTNVVWRMANEVSCMGTAQDFVRAAPNRLLFPHVEPGTVPLDAQGMPDAAAVDAIRENIRYLHAYVLGEELEPGSPEIDRTYELFHATLAEGATRLAAGELSPWLHYRCYGRLDPLTGELLPVADQLRQDPSYAIRAWMAVMSYLLADYRFIYE